MSYATVLKRVEGSAEVGFELSSRFSRVGQVLPSAVYEYTTFAEQIQYLAIELEHIGTVLPSLKLPEGAKIFGDVLKLVNFADAAYEDVKEALPSRAFDGEVELLLPFDTDALIEQVEALQAASTVITTILNLGSKISETPTVSVRPSRRIAESLVYQILRVIKSLKVSQPKAPKHRGVASKRAKAHEAITEWISEMLVPCTETEDIETEAEAKTEEKADAKKKLLGETEKVNSITFNHFGADPIADGMPSHIRHRPDRVYAKVHSKDVDERSLSFYGLPWSKLKDDPNYYVIWKSMEVWECDNLFMHTQKLRINEDHASIKPKEVIDSLLKKWAHANPEDIPAVPITGNASDREQFEKDLQELRDQDEKPKDNVRPIIRERSFSPPPARLPPPRRYIRENEAKTEYWRPWGQQSSQLFSSLKARGWMPVYMRGTDIGQTWFYGPTVAHIRRFDSTYTPQEGPLKLEKDSQIREYLIISGEWIEEEAILRFGFQFDVLSSGHFSLDPRLTWGDIELLVGATSTFREERLYRKYRSLPGGDLHEVRKLAVPDGDFLHGPALPELPRGKGVEYAKPATRVQCERFVSTPANQIHILTRLDDLFEDEEDEKVTLHAPSVESHDSFVEVEK